VLDDGSDLWSQPFAFLWDAYALAAFTPEFIFRVTVLTSISFLSCKLLSAVRGRSPLLVASWEFSVFLPFWPGGLLVHGSSFRRCCR